MNCNHTFGAASILSNTDRKLMNVLPNILRTEIQANPEFVTVTGTCPFCRETWAVHDVPVAGFHAWRNGEYVQFALPALTPQQREYLISGVCADCWSKL